MRTSYLNTNGTANYVKPLTLHWLIQHYKYSVRCYIPGDNEWSHIYKDEKIHLNKGINILRFDSSVRWFPIAPATKEGMLYYSNINVLEAALD